MQRISRCAFTGAGSFLFFFSRALLPPKGNLVQEPSLCCCPSMHACTQSGGINSGYIYKSIPCLSKHFPVQQLHLVVGKWPLYHRASEHLHKYLDLSRTAMSASFAVSHWCEGVEEFSNLYTSKQRLKQSVCSLIRRRRNATGLIVKAVHVVFQPFDDGLEIFMILQETVARRKYSREEEKGSL